MGGRSDIWSDELIAQLKQLWADDVTAQKIADTLGAGLSRDAVKSKAHRLGLAERPPDQRPARHPTRDAEILRRWDLGESQGVIAEAMRTTRSVVAGVVGRAGKQRREPSAVRQRAGGRKQAAKLTSRRVVTARVVKSRLQERVILPAIADHDIPIEQRRTILTVRDHECRFPFGDPREADFVLCGGTTLTGLPYCGFHARVVYQPPENRGGGRHEFRPRFGRLKFLTTEMPT